MPYIITQGYGTDGVSSGTLVTTQGYGSAGYLTLELLAIDPQVEYIDLTFTQELAPLFGQAADPEFWTLTGPIEVLVTGVELLSLTVVRLYITEAKDGATYTLNMPESGLQSTGAVPYTGPEEVVFVAVADPPVALLAQVLDSRRVRVIFSEPVIADEATDASNYSIDPPLTVSAVTQENSRNYVLTTSPQTPTVLYTITVVNVRDNSDNEV